ncbi:MAG: hypothetical protein CL889_03135 [Dehalococcoidia bacterium]|nr:hypothetical protein [Dehalococcoidia bacterium]
MGNFDIIKNDIDWAGIQNNISGYDVSLARAFDKEIKELCTKYGLLSDEYKTLASYLIPLLLNEVIQNSKEEWNRDD